ncbi:unnamed protein product, partial [Didymodactylos carnosus]
YNEGEIHFNLMAIVSDIKQKYQREIEQVQADKSLGDAEAKQKIEHFNLLIKEEERKINSYKIENYRRRHNWLPFIVELLKSYATQGILVPAVDKAIAIKQAEKEKEDAILSALSVPVRQNGSNKPESNSIVEGNSSTLVVSPKRLAARPTKLNPDEHKKLELTTPLTDDITTPKSTEPWLFTDYRNSTTGPSYLFQNDQVNQSNNRPVSTRQKYYGVPSSFKDQPDQFDQVQDQNGGVKTAKITDVLPENVDQQSRILYDRMTLETSDDDSYDFNNTSTYDKPLDSKDKPLDSTDKPLD